MPAVTGPRRFLAFVVLQGCLLLAGSGVARAGERYALIITGASGGPQYAEKYDEWRSSFVQLLQGPLGYPEANVLVLAEEEFAGAQRATRENARAAIADLRKRATKDDVVLVVLVGHGSGNDVGDAKFNLVGPDMSAAEWGELLRPMPGRLVFINGASGSAPFLQELSARNHVVITANDSAAQTFETVFPQFLLEAYRNNGADLDKNDRVSVFEAFAFISSRVREWFEQRSQLATEHAVLDDNGDGVGRLIDDEGADGLLARLTYVRADPRIEDTGNPERTAMLRRRAELNTQIEELRARKNTMPLDDYARGLETLLLELARIDRALRSKS